MILIPISKINDNPFQPRQEYGDIEELAEKIVAMRDTLQETRGLIHVPNARLIVAGEVMNELIIPQRDDSIDWHVELAEGHRRLRAFRLLAERDPEYVVMPVNLVHLTDQQMDDIAWDENVVRKDLSPIEEARSLKRSLEEFRLTQGELAERRKLGRSTVANKMRLLSLPIPLLDAIHSGRISERLGMAYLPLLDIAIEDLRQIDRDLTRQRTFMLSALPHPDTLASRMLDIGDLTADQVRTIVERIKQRVEFARKQNWEGQAERKAVEGLQVAGGSEPVARPQPIPMPSKPAPVLTPVAASTPAIIPVAAPEPQPDVTVTVHIKRNPDGSPATFTLSIGEDNEFPKFHKGAYIDMLQVIEQACYDYFYRVGKPLIRNEQLLMTEA